MLIVLVHLFIYGAAPPEVYTLSLHDALPICSNDGVVSAGQNQEAVTAQDAHRQVFVKVEEQPARQLEQPLPWRRPKIIRSRRVKAVQNLVPGSAGAFRGRSPS